MAAPRNDNVKEKILNATETLLQKKNLSDITLSEIAIETGISKGTLYYYYKNKTDIYMDITSRYLEQQWEDFIAWTENKEKDTSIVRLINYVVQRNIASYRTRLHLINAASLGDERSNLFSPKFFAQLMLLVSDGLIVQEALGSEAINPEEFVAQSLEYIKMLDQLV